MFAVPVQRFSVILTEHWPAEGKHKWLERLGRTKWPLTFTMNIKIIWHCIVIYLKSYVLTSLRQCITYMFQRRREGVTFIHLNMRKARKNSQKFASN